MIEFSNFYQLIAKNQLSHWLETLPAQIAACSAISSTAC
ncbi:tRNA (mo5U34)-methyltransferase [Enterobacter asburiae]|uniref:tRNA (Mo5U34)-methyltransferase n=1 Tax=Enterobacter asburiae TaxID=61645 RepID=A0A376FD23_ENTAS|nr:tRNA (mo5U34)-methyltransferase [Enterobacter asburiae]